MKGSDARQRDGKVELEGLKRSNKCSANEGPLLGRYIISMGQNDPNFFTAF